MRFAIILFVSTIALIFDFHPVGSQEIPEKTPSINLSGPRVGFTYLTGGSADRLKGNHITYPGLVQFGYQFEKRFFSTSPNGLTALIEFIPLIGGLDQGLAIPSFTWLFGVRTANGLEIGVGPNLTVGNNKIDSNALRSGIVIAAGISLRAGDINFPINFSATRSESGARFSLLTGFNIP